MDDVGHEADEDVDGDIRQCRYRHRSGLNGLCAADTSGREFGQHMSKCAQTMGFDHM